PPPILINRVGSAHCQLADPPIREFRRPCTTDPAPPIGLGVARITPSGQRLAAAPFVQSYAKLPRSEASGTCRKLGQTQAWSRISSAEARLRRLTRAVAKIHNLIGGRLGATTGPRGA